MEFSGKRAPPPRSEYSHLGFRVREEQVDRKGLEEQELLLAKAGVTLDGLYAGTKYGGLLPLQERQAARRMKMTGVRSILAVSEDTTLQGSILD